ncbi:MAG: UDP-glucose/GDP-mannose dehydrogenase family protein [Candidatus Omnitrophica bacterium]|nr:UDP-glucose/GDP-mannose dehydrogenase family protein [Candidatus Omnitrophota bacterium]
MAKKAKHYNICVVGAGHVGLVAAACFSQLGHQVICTDNNKQKINSLKKLKLPFYEPDLEPLVRRNYNKKKLLFINNLSSAIKKSEVIFIAVSTPPLEDGSLDLTYVENVARTISENINSYKLIVSKSTVPVLTGKKIKETIQRYEKNKIDFEVASNPEFLREGQAVKDFFYPNRIVLGVESKKGEKILRDIHSSLKSPVIVTDIGAAEIIKHASNSFLATKISFINAVSRICDLAGVNIDQVAEAMGVDERIGEDFLQAGVGYGGSCFPKDLDGFKYISKKLGYDFGLLSEVKKINESQPNYFIEKLKERIWVLKDKKITILGLSFKANTDDIRFAPSIKVINLLKNQKAHLCFYDPQVKRESVKNLLKDKNMRFYKDPYAAIKDSECICLLTDWPEFKKLNFKKIKKIMKYPFIADGRNILDKQKMIELGFEYLGIGR